MMTKIKRILILAVLTISLLGLSGCSDMKLATNAGVNLHFGPGGPSLNPYFNVGMYGGSRPPRYW